MSETLGAPFVRVYRSFVVTGAHIKLLQPEQLVLADGSALSIGSSYKPDLLAWFEK